MNDAIRIVTGCLRPAPADNLPILAGIQPAEHRHKGATSSPAHRAISPGRLLHSAAPTYPSSGNAWLLKSRHLFVHGAQQFISSCDGNNNNNKNVCSGRITDGVRSGWRTLRYSVLRPVIPDIGTHPARMTLPRTVGFT